MRRDYPAYPQTLDLKARTGQFIATAPDTTLSDGVYRNENRPKLEDVSGSKLVSQRDILHTYMDPLGIAWTEGTVRGGPTWKRPPGHQGCLKKFSQFSRL